MEHRSLKGIHHRDRMVDRGYGFAPFQPRGGFLFRPAASPLRVLLLSLAVASADVSASEALGEGCDDWGNNGAAVFWRTATVETVAACVADAGFVDARDEDGLTPLLWAARYSGDHAVVKALVSAGADVNARAQDGGTPLHLAVRFNENVAVMKMLINAGADVHAADEDGNTPLDPAPDEIRDELIWAWAALHEDPNFLPHGTRMVMPRWMERYFPLGEIEFFKYYICSTNCCAVHGPLSDNPRAYTYYIPLQKEESAPEGDIVAIDIWNIRSSGTNYRAFTTFRETYLDQIPAGVVSAMQEIVALHEKHAPDSEFVRSFRNYCSD